METCISKHNFFNLLSNLLFLVFFIWDRTTSSFSFFANCQFVTFLNFYLNWLYFIFSYFVIFKITENKILTKSFMDKYFNFCFVTSFSVGVIFWLIYLLNSQAIFKEGYSLPLMLNIFAHGGNFLLLLIEQLFINKRRVIDYKDYVPVYVYFIISFLYFSLIKGIYYFTSFGVYPFVRMNIIMYSCIVILSFIVCTVGHYIYKFISYGGEEDNIDNEEKVEHKYSLM